MTYWHVLFYFFMQVKKEKTYRLSYQLGVSSYASTTVVGYFTKWKISFFFLQRSGRIKIFFSWKNRWNHLPFEKFSFWLIYRAEKELRKWKKLDSFSTKRVKNYNEMQVYFVNSSNTHFVQLKTEWAFSLINDIKCSIFSWFV